MSVDQAPGVETDTADAVPPPAPAGRSGRRRRRRAEHRGRRRFLVVTGTALVAGAVWWLGWASPVTLVEHVVVDAPHGISEKAVRKASGIAATDHVPGVDAARVRTNVMAALPAVATVRVRRSLPNTVTVTVSRRTPFAALPAATGYVVVDSTGVEFDRVDSAGRLPVIRTTSAEGRTAALTVLESLPSDLRASVENVRATTHHDVDLVLSDGATVRWGSPDEAGLKAKVLVGLRSVKARHYDVSAPMMPTTSG